MFEPYKWIKSSSAIGGAGSPKDFQLSESSTCIIPSHRVDITNCASGVLAATQYLFADRKTWNWNSFGWSHILSCFSLPGCISTKISCCALRVCTKSARSSGQSKRPKRMKEWMLLGQGDMFEVLVKIYEVHHGKVRTQWGYIYIIYMNIYIYMLTIIYIQDFFSAVYYSTSLNSCPEAVLQAFGGSLAWHPQEVFRRVWHPAKWLQTVTCQLMSILVFIDGTWHFSKLIHHPPRQILQHCPQFGYSLRHARVHHEACTNKAES